VFRGTPLIAQLFMIYYGLPQFGIELDPIPAAMIGLSLNTAAYTSETLRAAISSIDKGQWEAAQYRDDAVANAASGNPAAGGARGVAAAQQQLYQPGERYLAGGNDSGAGVVPSGAAITSRTLEVFTMYLAASLIYWVMATVLSALQNYFENQLNRQERDPK
jgi:cystine transport system permease protein